MDSDSPPPGKYYDALLVHTEDLVDPESKFETVRQIAGFIGAEHFTNDELCCLVVAPAVSACRVYILANV